MNDRLKILHLEDLPSDVELVSRELKKGGIEYDALVVDNKADYVQALKSFAPDIVLSDHSLPMFDSREALFLLKETGLKIPFVLVTATISEEYAVEIMKDGAYDYVLKDRLQRLPQAVLNAMEKWQMENEKQKYLQEIISNEALLKEAEHLAHFGSWQTDFEKGFSKWSDESYRILGYKPGEIQPSLENFLSTVHPEDFAYVKDTLESSIQTHNSHKLNFRIIDKDGAIKYIRSELVIERNREKQTIRITGFNQDVTEMKLSEDARSRAEKELKTTHERLLFHIENTPLGFIEWDSKMKIRSLSARAEQIFGWSMKEFLEAGMTGEDMVYEEDLFWVTSVFEELVNGNLDRNKVLNRNVKRDGTIIWCEWFNSVMKDPDGKVNTIMSLVQDVTDRKEAEKEILKMNAQLRELTSHLQNIREEERKRIAREIHDELGQQLTGIKMDLAMIRQNTVKPHAISEESISEVMNMVDDAIKTVRKISSELRPSVIDDLGLIAAMNWQCHEFEKRYNIPCSFTSTMNEFPFEKDLVTGIFRIYQESLTNIARHSKASEISATLTVEEKSIMLSIRDNGVGFNPNNMEKKTLGIIGMKERAIMLGGALNIDSEVGKGTKIIVRIPMKN